MPHAADGVSGEELKKKAVPPGPASGPLLCKKEAKNQVWKISASHGSSKLSGLRPGPIATNEEEPSCHTGHHCHGSPSGLESTSHYVA